MTINNNSTSIFKYLDIILGTIGILLSSFLYSTLKLQFAESTSIPNILTFLFPIFIFSLVFLFHKIRSRFSIIPHLTNKKHFWVSVLLGLALGIVPNIIEYIVNGFEDVSLKPTGTSTLEMLLSQVVVSSYEELIFRGLLFLGLVIRSKNIFISALISGICFSALHFQTYSITEQWYIHLCIISMGITLCYLYIVFRSLWAPIITHFSNNVFVNVFNYPDPPIGPIALSGLSLPLILVLICITLIYYQQKNREIYSVNGFLVQ